MAQKFLSIRESDYERIKTRASNAPWIRLHRALYRDPDFLNLSTHHRYLYTGLLQLAYDTCNHIYNDSTYLGQMLYVKHTEVDLRPLYRSGLLVTSNLSRTLSETETEKSRREQSRAEHVEAPPPLSAMERLEQFTITDELEEWARKEGINDIASYVDEFKDYWRSVGGKRRSGQIIKDWSSTFKNRLRDLKKLNKLKAANVWGD